MGKVELKISGMIGVVGNRSRKMFITRDGQLVIKNVAAGNINQGFTETNDWVIGETDQNIIAHPGKYQGGNRADANNYDNSLQTDKRDYPDI